MADLGSDRVSNKMVTGFHDVIYGMTSANQGPRYRKRGVQMVVSTRVIRKAISAMLTRLSNAKTAQFLHSLPDPNVHVLVLVLI